MNVLIFPAGTEIGLEIYNSLIDEKNVVLFAAGQDLSNHAEFVFEKYFKVPSVNDENWIDSLNQVCLENKIDFIFPAHDDVVIELSKHKDKFVANVITPSYDLCEITRYKSKTYQILKSIIRVPTVFKKVEDVDVFPVFLKPDKGQGSQGVMRIDDVVSLKHNYTDGCGLLICEYLPGVEYTVDCFSDRIEGLKFCSARVRNRMRNGIAVNTEIVELKEVESLARNISNILGIYGAWFFQLKRSIDNELVLLEVAPRIAGSMAIHRVKGVNFAMLSIYEFLRVPIKLLINPGKVVMDRALSNRYKFELVFNCLYIDLDETIILNNKVNAKAISLIFKCINSNKKIYLITRHKSDLNETLERHRIKNIFDGVFHLKNGESKADYIDELGAIFVDDSFSERLDVQIKKGIQTFDLSMIEVLINSLECSDL